MKTADFKQLPDLELSEKLKQEQSNLSRLKFNHAVSALENPLKIRHQRRLVATLMTETSARKNKLQNNNK